LYDDIGAVKPVMREWERMEKVLKFLTASFINMNFKKNYMYEQNYNFIGTYYNCDNQICSIIFENIK